MWNSLDLKCPSDDFSEYSTQDRDLTENLQGFVTVLSTAANTLTSENPLWTELQVLLNIQKKYKRFLHCDKCLVFMHRIGTCTKKMVLLNLSKSYLDLAEKFLNGMQDFSVTYRLPSRQQLEYILIRTITASKLVCHGIKYSRDTFCFLIQKLKVGHLILDLVMAASVIARLHILLKATLEQLCSMYKETLSWRYQLKAGNFEWAQKLDFPQDLEEWLKISEAECLESFPISRDEVDRLSSLLKPSNEDKDSDSSDTDSIVVINEVHQSGSTEVDNFTGRSDIDYGEVIPRKKKKTSHQLNSGQKSLLQKILQVQSLRHLKELWIEISTFPSNHFPSVLTQAEKENINDLFIKIEETVSEKKFNKVFKNEPAILKSAHLVFSKHLGFSKNDVESCRNELIVPSTSGGESTSKKSNISKKSNMSSVSKKYKTSGISKKSKMSNMSKQSKTAGVSKTSTNNETLLAPVKTLRQLRGLYLTLCDTFKSPKEEKKLQKLQKCFKRRRADIKLLRRNGERRAARKLIFCTSKLMLTQFKRN